MTTPITFFVATTENTSRSNNNSSNLQVRINGATRPQSHKCNWPRNDSRNLTNTKVYKRKRKKNHTRSQCKPIMEVPIPVAITLTGTPLYVPV